MQETSALQKTLASVKRKKQKGPKHPYDKWVAIGEQIADASVGHRALIKSIADFIKVVLPETTLVQEAVTPKSESVELGTQIVQHPTTPPRSAPIPSSYSVGDVYETETSLVSIRFAGTTALACDDDGDTGVVSEGDVHKFARKSFGEIASPYLSPYVHKSGILDAEYGLRKVGDKCL
jgi:hypothetical protein